MLNHTLLTTIINRSAAPRAVIRLGFLVLLLLSLAGQGSPVMAQAQAEATSLDVVLVIDQSGSMWERNDPPIRAANGSVKNPGWRIVATNLLAQWLAIDQSGASHQLAVIMFGTDAKVVFPLQEIHSPNSQVALQQALSDNSQAMGGTNILEALRLAKSELDKGRSGSNIKKAVIFLSDGVCDPVIGTTDAQRKACETDIRALVKNDFVGANAIPIFAVALTSDAFKQDAANTMYKNLWQEISTTTGGDYYEPLTGERELLESFVQIQQRLFGLPIQKPPPPVDSPSELTYELPADLLQVSFSMIRYEPTISVTVIRPDNSTVLGTDPGVQLFQSTLTLNYSVSRPSKGAWKVRLTGTGKVIVIVTPFAMTRFNILREQPASLHPLGKPMQIQVRVSDVDGAIRTPQALTITVELPNGATVPLTMAPAGAFYAATLDNTKETGTYKLRFHGKLGDTSFSDIQNIRVVMAPWLQLVQPTLNQDYPSNLPLPVQAQVMLGTQPLTQLNNGDQLESSARLLDLSGKLIDTQFLRLISAGVFSGTLALAPEGVYTTQVQLAYRAASGEKYDDIAVAPLRVRGIAVSEPTTTPVPIVITPEPTPVPAAAMEFPTVPILAALAVVLLLALVVLAGMLVSLRNSLQQALRKQDVQRQDQRSRELTATLQPPQGWHFVAEQLVANALRENISMDVDAGIIDISTQPRLRFTLVTRDGRTVIFTTDLEFMRKAKLIRKGDHVVDLTKLSPTSHADASLLWQSVLGVRNMQRTTPPISAHWYMVVHLPGQWQATTRGRRR